MSWKWLTPAEGLPIEDVNRVELLSLVAPTPAPEHGWPESFWPHVASRVEVSHDDTKRVLTTFRDLEPGGPFRCHNPPWGLALYNDNSLIATATLCFSCANAYVHTSEGTDLRAFDFQGPNAKGLRALLERYLPIRES